MMMGFPDRGMVVMAGVALRSRGARTRDDDNDD